jgi:hypothetical protein
MRSNDDCPDRSNTSSPCGLASERSSAALSRTNWRPSPRIRPASFSRPASTSARASTTRGSTHCFSPSRCPGGGTIAQYAGRLHRLYDGKREVRIYDYADLEVPMLARMFDRRCRVVSPCVLHPKPRHVSGIDLVHTGVALAPGRRRHLQAVEDPWTLQRRDRGPLRAPAEGGSGGRQPAGQDPGGAENQRVCRSHAAAAQRLGLTLPRSSGAPHGSVQPLLPNGHVRGYAETSMYDDELLGWGMARPSALRPSR